MSSLSFMRENGGLYSCFHCDGLNRAPSGPCLRGARPIEGPPGLSLIRPAADVDAGSSRWRPRGHRCPDPRISALPRRLTALREAVTADRDPFLAVEALCDVGCERVTLWNSCGADAGQVVMHFHVHVVPGASHDPPVLTGPETPVAAEEIEAVATQLRDGA
jgi:HIT domain